jgi:hypothetical protein
MRSQSLLLTVGLVLLLALRAPALESTKPDGAEDLKAEGKIGTISDQALRVKCSDSESWLVNIQPGETKVEVTGTAEPGYLRSGMHVRFTGEIDDKGDLQSEITELEVFTPQGKNALGLFDPKDKSPSAKPVRKPTAGTYEIRAKLSLKENEVTLAAGNKKIHGTLADSAAVTVVSDDLSLAGEGDEASIVGWYYPQGKAAADKPGQAMADRVTVTLAKPLEAAKKPARAAKVAKTAKTRKRPKDEMEDGVDVPAAAGAGTAPSDPFGVDKK